MQLSFCRSLMAPFACAALFVACGGGGDDDDNGGTPDAGISASCMEATSRSDLPWIQENIFDTSCASFASCHMGNATSADGLNLEDGMSQAEMVDVDSVRDNRYKLVAPGNANDSYLLMIMGRNPSSNTVTIVRTMPRGNPLLCDEKVEAVARWVDSL